MWLVRRWVRGCRCCCCCASECPDRGAGRHETLHAGGVVNAQSGVLVCMRAGMSAVLCTWAAHMLHSWRLASTSATAAAEAPLLLLVSAAQVAV